MTKVTILFMDSTLRNDSYLESNKNDLSKFANDNLEKYITIGTIEFGSSITDLKNILSKTWELTNSVDYNWIENPEVKLTDPDNKKIRSAMVGDVYIVDDMPIVIDSYGFKKLVEETPKRARRANLGVAIYHAERKLIKKANEEGSVWENFGQDEVSRLTDKYIDSSSYSDSMNHNRMLLSRFNEWCMTYTVSNIKGDYQGVANA